MTSKKKGSKEDPLTIHYLLKALAIADGVSTRKVVQYPSGMILHRKGIKGIKAVTQQGITHTLSKVYTLKGGKVVFITDKRKELPVNTHFTRVYRDRVLKTFEDYQHQPTIIGTIRDYEKGGWHSDIPLYEFKGKYYARFECSSHMNSVYLADARI